ncbi:MAG: triose-phosphate isomerase [Gemmatimonadota bacterium]
MRTRIFAANWKMNVSPDEARAYARVFTAAVPPKDGRELWFFPPTVSLEATALSMRGRPDARVGAQNIYWEPKGAFTGSTSIALARAAGATTALVGHSERRHIFGESEGDTAKKVHAVLQGGLVPLLCVGEKLEEREANETESVVLRQLGSACSILTPEQLSQVVIAYEPVWAIGTGKNATPEDAAKVHRVLRAELAQRGHRSPRILYGGSVSEKNITGLLAEEEVDGVLVGGASLDPEGWARIVG